MPASSSPFDHCDCSCHEHEHGGGPQPATTAQEPDTKQKSYSHGSYSMDEIVKMNKKDFMAFIDRVRSPYRGTHPADKVLIWLFLVQGLTKDLDNRIAYLLNRREEIYKIMAMEREQHKEWRAKVKAKSEASKELKKMLLANMKREERMKIIKMDFIMTLLKVDFDHEVEDVYGAGNEIFRSFNDKIT